MTTDPAQITEVPLITVKTVKRKHLKGLFENRPWRTCPNPAPAFLGYITEWDSILARDKEGRISVIRAGEYYESIRYSDEVKGFNSEELNLAVEAAQRRVRNLSQLFLD